MKNRILLALLLLFSGCGFERMDAGQYGVVFSALPTWFFGGAKEKPLEPGEMAFIWPWQKVYRFDTSQQSIGWGGIGQGTNELSEDYVETRTLDGNEVGLAITVQYHIDPKMIAHVVQYVAPNEDRVRQIVAGIARADIRTHMNILRNNGFFSQQERQNAVDQVKKAMDNRLRHEGIVIDAVIYNDHRFERSLGDGNYDRSYQMRIDDTQATNQETQQEQKKVPVVIEQKRKELNEEQARVNRAVEEADGAKRQAVLYGDSFFQAKKNESQQILTAGMSEVEGLKKRIEALSGPGGEALLKLELIDYLTKANPKFILMNKGSAQGNLDLSKVDTNELIRQVGILAISQEGSSAAKTPSAASSPTATPHP